MVIEKAKPFTLENYIGVKIKKARTIAGFKIADVARISEISQGMISKIENAQVSTSLESLNRLCSALNLSMSTFFADFDRPDGNAQFTKANKGLEVVSRGTNLGHTYHLLAYQRGGHKTFEPFLVTMGDMAEKFPTFTHAGNEFIYILQGKITYRHGNKLYEMEAGDSLTFDAEIPHGPEQLTQVPVKLLSVINYTYQGN